MKKQRLEKKIPSLLPTPAPTATQVRASWDHFTPEGISLSREWVRQVAGFAKAFIYFLGGG